MFRKSGLQTNRGFENLSARGAVGAAAWLFESNAVMAYVLFDERLDTIAIIGMAACAAAVFVVNRRA